MVNVGVFESQWAMPTNHLISHKKLMQKSAALGGKIV